MLVPTLQYGLREYFKIWTMLIQQETNKLVHNTNCNDNIPIINFERTIGIKFSKFDSNSALRIKYSLQR